MAEILSFIHRIHLISYSFEITVAICTFRLHRDSISPGSIHPGKDFTAPERERNDVAAGVSRKGETKQRPYNESLLILQSFLANKVPLRMN